jgi:hypothetical protein
MNREEDASDSTGECGSMTRPAAQEGDVSSGRPQLGCRRRRRRSRGESSSQSPPSETSSKGGEEAVSDASSGPADGTSPTYSSPLREPILHYQITGYTSGGERVYKRIDDDMNMLREYRTKDAAYRRKLGIYMLLDYPQFSHNYCPIYIQEQTVDIHC